MNAPSDCMNLEPSATRRPRRSSHGLTSLPPKLFPAPSLRHLDALAPSEPPQDDLDCLGDKNNCTSEGDEDDELLLLAAEPIPTMRRAKSEAASSAPSPVSEPTQDWRSISPLPPRLNSLAKSVDCGTKLSPRSIGPIPLARASTDIMRTMTKHPEARRSSAPRLTAKIPNLRESLAGDLPPTSDAIIPLESPANNNTTSVKIAELATLLSGGASRIGFSSIRSIDGDKGVDVPASSELAASSLSTSSSSPIPTSPAGHSRSLKRSSGRGREDIAARSKSLSPVPPSLMSRGPRKSVTIPNLRASMMGISMDDLGGDLLSGDSSDDDGSALVGNNAAGNFPPSHALSPSKRGKQSFPALAKASLRKASSAPSTVPSMSGFHNHGSPLLPLEECPSIISGRSTSHSPIRGSVPSSRDGPRKSVKIADLASLMSDGASGGRIERIDGDNNSDGEVVSSGLSAWSPSMSSSPSPTPPAGHSRSLKRSSGHIRVDRSKSLSPVPPSLMSRGPRKSVTIPNLRASMMGISMDDLGGDLLSGDSSDDNNVSDDSRQQLTGILDYDDDTKVGRNSPLRIQSTHKSVTIPSSPSSGVIVRDRDNFSNVPSPIELNSNVILTSQKKTVDGGSVNSCPPPPALSQSKERSSKRRGLRASMVMRRVAGIIGDSSKRSKEKLKMATPRSQSSSPEATIASMRTEKKNASPKLSRRERRASIARSSLSSPIVPTSISTRATNLAKVSPTSGPEATIASMRTEKKNTSPKLSRRERRASMAPSNLSPPVVPASISIRSTSHSPIRPNSGRQASVANSNSRLTVSTGRSKPRSLSPRPTSSAGTNLNTQRIMRNMHASIAAASMNASIPKEDRSRMISSMNSLTPERVAAGAAYFSNMNSSRTRHTTAFSNLSSSILGPASPMEPF